MVLKSRSAARSGGNVTSILPLIVLNCVAAPGARSKDASTGPFTVEMRPAPRSPVSRTAPLTFEISKSPRTPFTTISPLFTVDSSTPASRGTRTSIAYSTR